jgi:hypothetical protein
LRFFEWKPSCREQNLDGVKIRANTAGAVGLRPSGVNGENPTSRGTTEVVSVQVIPNQRRSLSLRQHDSSRERCQLAVSAGEVRLDPRRSASDHPRLVAAYTLALAAASEAMKGLHPGFVILDEPLQQNPDKKHRDLFINFLTSDFARATTVQTIVITWLHEDELQRLADAGVRLLNPSGEHFLELLPPPPPPDDQTPVEAPSDAPSE